MNDRQRLEAIVSVVCRYLPPDGIPINEAMSEIISLIDPLPPAPAPAQPMTQDMVESCPYYAETFRGAYFDGWLKAEAALRERLEQPEQKPFCFHDGRNIVGKEFADHSDVFPLYTASPLRQWQGLTEEDLFDIAIVNFGEPDLQLFIEMGKLVQEELKEKNT